MHALPQYQGRGRTVQGMETELCETGRPYRCIVHLPEPRLTCQATYGVSKDQVPILPVLVELFPRVGLAVAMGAPGTDGTQAQENHTASAGGRGHD